MMRARLLGSSTKPYNVGGHNELQRAFLLGVFLWKPIGFSWMHCSSALKPHLGFILEGAVEAAANIKDVHSDRKEEDE